MAKKSSKDIWTGQGGFAGIPRKVMESSDYKNLSGSAVKLLLELASQYKGRKAANNGDLTCAWSLLKERGFKSKATLQRCKEELLSKKFIIETRKGIAGVDGRRVCSLYAVSWQPIDEVFYSNGNPKHSLAASATPPRTNWS